MAGVDALQARTHIPSQLDGRSKTGHV